MTPKSVQPGKVAPHLHPPCSVPYGGQEIGHHGRYDVLIIDEGNMEWVHTSHGGHIVLPLAQLIQKCLKVAFLKAARPLKAGYVTSFFPSYRR